MEQVVEALIQLNQPGSRRDAAGEEGEENRLSVLRHLEGIYYEMSMKMSEDEVEWAYAIKDAVEADTELENVSDYEYASYAIVCRENLEEALSKLKGLQHFRSEYGIVASEETAEMGLKAMAQLQQQSPFMLLEVDYHAGEGHFLAIMDGVQTDPEVYKTDAGRAIFLRSMYFLYQMMQSNLLSVRQGVIFMFECEGYGFEHFSPAMTQRLWYHLMSFYPFHCKELYFVHSSVVANLMSAMFKSLRMGSFAEKIRMGCDFPGRLDGIYTTPTREAAEERLMSRLYGFLRVRYINQAHFALPPREAEAIAATTVDGAN